MCPSRVLFALLLVGLLAAPAASAGERIVYSADGGVIESARPDSSGRQVVVDAAVFGPHLAVSPDGMRVAFECDPEYDPSGDQRQICVSDWDGQNRVKLTGWPGENTSPAWSPDGEQIIFASTRNGAGEIFAMDADGSDQTSLGELGNDPEFSPDGTRVAFVSSRDGNNELYSMAADGSGATRLTETAAAELAPAWSPNGAQIAYTRADPKANGPDLYRMAADGSDAVRLTSANADYSTHASAPDWSPGGSRIAYGCGRDVCTAAASDGGSRVNVTAGFQDGGNTAFGRPGWTAELGPKPAISVTDASGSENESDYGNATFEVRLDRASDDPVTVDLDTADGTATAPADYEARDETLTVPAGLTSYSVPIRVAEDSDEEPQETFDLQLSNANGGTIGDGQGRATIVDNDGSNPNATFSYQDAGAFDIAFDATGSSDAEGQVTSYEWSFGDGTTGTGATPSHSYPGTGQYTVVLTVTDSAGKASSYQDYVQVSAAGVGFSYNTYVAVDERLRCIVGTDSVFARRGTACGTFVSYGGTLYAPRGAIPGAAEGEDYTAFEPVSQSSSGDGWYTPWEVSTKVELGDTGVYLEQSDTTGGGSFYRTDVKLTGATLPARIYRAGDCFNAGSTRGYGYEDSDTATAGCARATDADIPTAAFLPLSAGARHQAGGASDVFGAITGRQDLSGDCNCDDATIDNAAAIAWNVPSGDSSPRGSLTAYPSDGRLPLLVYAAPDFATAEPGGENGIAIDIRNPNAHTVTVHHVSADLSDGMSYREGSTTGVTTEDPDTDCGGCAWIWYGDWAASPHAAVSLHFGVTHSSTNGTDTVQAGGELADGWHVVGARPTASVTVAPAPPGPPETAITEGPSGPTNDNTPTFRFSSQPSGDDFQCRLSPAVAYTDCESGYTPRALRDGQYTFEVAAVKNEVPDPTPASRTFTVDTIAPATSIVSAPPKLSNNREPEFRIESDEDGARLQCRLFPAGGTAEFRTCSARYRSAQLSDGAYVFEARSVDAAGNADPSPPRHEWTVDATPPDTGLQRTDRHADEDSGFGSDDPAMAPVVTAAQAGSQLPVVGDGVTTVQIACPADAPAPCVGGVVMTSGEATVARADFHVDPGNTEQVPVPLPDSVSNRIERTGSLPVDVSTGPGTEEERLVLMPDPRTPRVLDAGVRLPADERGAGMRLACPRKRKEGCAGSVRLEELPALLRGAGTRAKTPRTFGKVTFKVRGGKRGRPRIALSRAARTLLRRRRSLHVSVRVATRQRGAKTVHKTLDLTLTSKRRKP